MATESDPAFVSKPAPPDYRYAGAWIRLGALIIDGLLLGVALFAVFMVVGLAIAGTGDTLMSLETEGWPAGAVVYVLTSIVMLGWYGGWQSRVGGTPGMLLLKLRVLDPGGLEKPSFGAAVVRNSPQVLANFGAVSGSAVIDGALGLVGLVVYIAIGITIAESPTRQGFHDRLADGTFVVRPAPTLPPPPPLPPPSAPPT
jgi:uncharacterized RDD family membrane protein YckC